MGVIPTTLREMHNESPSVPLVADCRSKLNDCDHIRGNGATAPACCRATFAGARLDQTEGNIVGSRIGRTVLFVASVISLRVWGQFFAESGEHTLLRQMKDHHESGVAMSDLCLKRAQRSELKSICQDMKDAQSREIREMKELV